MIFCICSTVIAIIVGKNCPHLIHYSVIQLRDLKNGKRLHERDGYNIRAITPDGQKAIFSLDNTQFALLDLETEQITGPKLVHGGISLNILAITPYGRKAISDSIATRVQDLRRLISTIYPSLLIGGVRDYWT
jgi:hypothetical protein